MLPSMPNVKKNQWSGTPGHKPGGKLLRLRGRTRPLFECAMYNGSVKDSDADVLFVCEDGKILSAHKVILAVASKFFAQILHGQTSKKPTIIHVPDVSQEVMRIILLLCYKDSVNIPLRIMADIGNYLSMFGLGLDKFVVVEPVPETTSVSMPRLKQSAPTPGTSHQQQQQLQTRKIVESHTVPQPQVALKPHVQLINVGGKLFTATAATGVAAANQVHSSGQQTYSLDPNLMSNGGGAQEDSDYGTPVKIVKPAPKELPRSQPRLILPKPPGFSQQQTQRTRDGPPVLQRMNTSPSSADMPIEVEMDGDDDDMEHDSEDAQEMLQHWMDNVGKPSSSGGPPQLVKISPVKRKPNAPGISGPSGFLTSPPPVKLAKHQCSVCHEIFDTNEKFQWHTERHIGIGIFKCIYCESRFNTVRKVYQHELMEHSPVQTFHGDQPLIGHLPPGDAQRSWAAYKASSNQFARRVSGLKAAAAKRKALQLSVKKPKIATYSKLHQNFASKNPLIGIGVQDGEDLVDSRKLKQLHWLYVCSKCDHCADSTAKAIAHYKSCYPDRELQFEKSVVKYRQGFYGKIRCPLCPRRYTSLAGFLIHCGHMHQDYRRIFSHLNYEDKMMCVNCREKYDGPSEFHAHLNRFSRCEKSNNNDDNESGSYREDMSAGSSTQSFEETRQKQYARLLGTNPRSQRLQNKLASVTACFEDDPQEVNEDELGDVTCPVCNNEGIVHVPAHLREAHSDLDIRVDRVDRETLKCKDCGISFALCDLVIHAGSCTENKGMNYLSRNTKKPIVPKSPAPPKVFEYPPGIGESPIDTMENPNLLSKELVLEALVCPVCKRAGKKLNAVGDCLRVHGIWRCSVCFNTYTSREDSSLHMKQCHGIANSHKLSCPVCKIPRANAGQLASHMINIHWVPLLRYDGKDDSRLDQSRVESSFTDDSKDDLNISLAANDSSLDQFCIRDASDKPTVQPEDQSTDDVKVSKEEEATESKAPEITPEPQTTAAEKPATATASSESVKIENVGSEEEPGPPVLVEMVQQNNLS